MIIRFVGAGLLVFATVLGTLADRPRVHQPMIIGGYQVLAADFHTHSSMWSDGGLTPWGLVLEAERHGLDAIAITGHDEVLDSRIGRRFSAAVGGPIVLRGEEILAEPKYHMIAVGITQRVSFRLSAARAIDEIHRQGGIAIAAHPQPGFAGGYDEAARQRLDGAEICHPNVYGRKEAQGELEQFSAGASFAAIGSSDFHGLGVMALCRTYVFAADRTEQDILDALRAHRTVVYGPNGRAYGDPALVRLAAADGRPAHDAAPPAAHEPTDWVSGACGVAGLAGLLLFGAPVGGIIPGDDAA